ncbi:hypothetical protein KKC22_01395 [Myxococcota bacterium]|nr:hypothetical protein [Myxococcota bacterium]
MKTKRSYNPLQKRMLGRRYSSNDIARQLQEVLMLWRLFLSTFTEYGLGPEALAEFEAVAAAHEALVVGRPGAITAKSLSIAERDATINAAWVWVGKVGVALGKIAREDTDCANKLNAARPDEDHELWWCIGAMASLLQEKAGQLAASVPTTERLEEATGLRERLAVIFSAASEAKQAPVQDTAEIDELDGQLYLMMRDFLEAGREAVRAGLIDRPISTFRFTFIGPAANRRNHTPPAEPTPQV